MPNNLFICKVCGKSCNGLPGLSQHIHSHNLSSQEYFDNYVEPHDDHVCYVCKTRKRKFHKFRYEKTCCCKECRYKDVENTCIEKYGVKNVWQESSTKEKIRNTLEERHGSRNFNNRDKAAATCLEKYGCINPGQVEEVKKKIETTQISHWGTLYAKTHEASKHRKKIISYKGYNVASRWELDVIKFCEKNSIDFEYEPKNFIIFYTDKLGKEHQYQPDFLINGKLYEVKGPQFFNECGEMISPFKMNDGLDDFRDDLAKRKQKAMKENNVIVLSSNEMKNLKEYIKHE